LELYCKEFFMELCSIITEDIDQIYVRGRYGEFDVIMARADCFVNATKLCAIGRKQFKHWLENVSSKRLIEEVRLVLKSEDEMNISNPEVMRMITGGNNIEVRGTYVHPLLVPQIACWVSAKFAIAASLIVNNALIQRHKCRAAKFEAINKDLTNKISNLEDALKQVVSLRDPFSRAALPGDEVAGIGCLYFITYQDAKHFKIGYTACIRERLQQLQVGCPFTLYAYATFLSVDPREAETAAHVEFAARLERGEWYRLSSTDVDEYVAHLHACDSSTRDAGPTSPIQDAGLISPIPLTNEDIETLIEEYS
jgi:hypothetical protein